MCERQRLKAGGFLEFSLPLLWEIEELASASGSGAAGKLTLILALAASTPAGWPAIDTYRWADREEDRRKKNERINALIKL